jgi:hypothetical protein
LHSDVFGSRPCAIGVGGIASLAAKPADELLRRLGPPLLTALHSGFLGSRFRRQR